MSWRKIVLFGDSLTQYSFDSKGWGAIIANHYQRKCDVFNRGYSGYTTNQAVEMFNTVFDAEFVKVP